MKIIITDTNVFIDLIKSGALDFFFQCPFEVCTTDLVLEEIKPQEQRAHLEKHVATNRLRVLQLSTEDILAAIQLPTQSNLKRITDKSVLLKAIQMQACLLSGDGDLRKEGQRAGLEVRGSLWVIREIWLAGLSNVNDLLSMLDELSRNTRLPIVAIEELRNEILAFG
jgi:predicted nucleic acid-binding protein